MIERSDYLRKDRPAPPVTEWWAWRRKKGDPVKGIASWKVGPAGTWEHFKDADSPTRGQCYQKCMDLSELVGHEGEWEYLITPAGQRPPLF